MLRTDLVKVIVIEVENFVLLLFESLVTIGAL